MTINPLAMEPVNSECSKQIFRSKIKIQPPSKFNPKKAVRQTRANKKHSRRETIWKIEILNLELGGIENNQGLIIHHKSDTK